MNYDATLKEFINETESIWVKALIPLLKVDPAKTLVWCPSDEEVRIYPAYVNESELYDEYARFIERGVAKVRGKNATSTLDFYGIEFTFVDERERVIIKTKHSTFSYNEKYIDICRNDAWVSLCKERDVTIKYEAE